MKKIVLILFIVLFSCVLFTGCGITDAIKDIDDNKNGTYGLGDTFTFDKLEITIGNKIEFTTCDNEFSDYYEKDVIKIAATIKNLKDSAHCLNMFDYEYVKPNGSEANSVDTYFDDAVGWNAGNLQTGASYTKGFYIAYEGDGKYAITFDNYSQEITVEFDVTIGENSIANKKTEYGIGETFRYHFMEITAQDISFTTVDNKFSSYNGKDIIRIPLLIKNIADEKQHLNSYSVTLFGPDGVEVDTADTYFDDSIGWGAGDLASGISYVRAFYAVYTGNGNYVIEFNSSLKLIISVNK